MAHSIFRTAFFTDVSRAFGRRLKSVKSSNPVPCWTEYLRDTADRS